MLNNAQDNLLQMALAPIGAPLEGATEAPNEQLCYRKALEICTYVQSRIVRADGRLNVSVPAPQLHRLQNVFYTSSTIYRMLGHDGISPLAIALELVIRPPSPYLDSERYSLRDFVLATIIAGLMTANLGANLPQRVEAAMTPQGQRSFSLRAREPGYDLIGAVHESGNRLVEAFAPDGVGVLPMLLLSPEQAMRLPHLIFPASMGVLPSICTKTNVRNRLETPHESVRQQSHSMTSTILLGLAKQIQDTVPGSDLTIPGFNITVQASPSLTLLLYYLALSLSPSPAIYNNMGLILSMLPASTQAADIGRRSSPTGIQLARTYYERGLQMDSTHPHLLTNMGSLLKDGGQTPEAIR
jgi:protein O-GlcNAc transferase